MKKALVYGILASLFFAFTFLLNRSMNLAGGYWMWSAALRYIFMLPMLALLLWRLPGRRFSPVLSDIKKQPVAWFLWSTVGFGLFYLPLTLASVFGESWLTAASWQVTIAAFLKSGLPGQGQVIQSGAVALFSGVIATILFFHATDLVRSNPKQLAVIKTMVIADPIKALIDRVKPI